MFLGFVGYKQQLRYKVIPMQNFFVIGNLCFTAIQIIDLSKNMNIKTKPLNTIKSSLSKTSHFQAVS